MSSFENNKIFAALLCALIAVWVTGFIADRAFDEQILEKDAVFIEGSIVASANAAPARPKIPDPVMALLATADIERGAKISKACAACHSFDKGGPVKQGPNLWGIVNKDKTSTSGFKYSKGLKALDGKWGYDSLNKFLTKPKKFAPGTKMNFAGLKKAKDRAALIMWLREQGSANAPLPSAAQIQAEQAAFAPPPVAVVETEAENAQDTPAQSEDTEHAH